MKDSVAFLTELGALSPGGLLDVRAVRPSGSAERHFVAVGDERRASSLIARAAADADVYVGVLPRAFRAGRRQAVPHGATVWVDIDTAEAAACVGRLVPKPSMLVQSGSPGHVHAYWLLDRLWPAASIEDANRRLASTIRADLRCTDATRVLRPPGTLNHRHQPPACVVLDVLDARRRTLQQILADVPAPPSLSPLISSANRKRSARAGIDPLLAIAPSDYVERLTGRRPDRHGKVVCPLHDDTRPSLHAYRDPSRGWYCYGCRRGGSIYDLAAAAWGTGTKGAAFTDLRARLRAKFL
jgi:hypothetical protein